MVRPGCRNLTVQKQKPRVRRGAVLLRQREPAGKEGLERLPVCHAAVPPRRPGDDSGDE